MNEHLRNALGGMEGTQDKGFTPAMLCWPFRFVSV